MRKDQITLPKKIPVHQKWERIMFKRDYFLHILLFHQVVFSDQKLVQHNGIRCYTKKCDKNQTFRRCATNFGEDKCINCPPNYINCDAINTGSERAADLLRMNMSDDICVKHPTCLPGSTLRAGDICQYLQNDEYCECDRESLYFGTDWRKCSKIKSMPLQGHIEQRGQELKLNGTVGPCEDGFYKDKEDFSICQRWTKCATPDSVKTPGTRTTDTLCLNNTNPVISDWLESKTREGVSVAVLIAAPITGVFVSAVVLSIIIYCICGSKISGFFKHLRSDNAESPETEPESNTLLPSQTYSACEKRANSNVDTADSKENGKLTETEEAHDGTTNSHETACKDIEQISESNTQLKLVTYPESDKGSEMFTCQYSNESENQGNDIYTNSPCIENQQNTNTSTVSSSQSCDGKPTAIVAPIRSEHQQDDNLLHRHLAQDSIDSLHLSSAPPLSLQSQYSLVS